MELIRKEVELIRKAQGLARVKRNTTEDSIACPFFFMGDYTACRLCHTWMDTDIKQYFHPCTALNNDLNEIRKRFWRKP